MFAFKMQQSGRTAKKYGNTQVKFNCFKPVLLYSTGVNVQYSFSMFLTSTFKQQMKRTLV